MAETTWVRSSGLVTARERSMVTTGTGTLAVGESVGDSVGAGEGACGDWDRLASVYEFSKSGCSWIRHNRGQRVGTWGRGAHLGGFECRWGCRFGGPLQAGSRVTLTVSEG
jgi:hypothetical protein